MTVFFVPITPRMTSIFGKEREVLEPRWLREQMKNIGADLYQNHLDV